MIRSGDAVLLIPDICRGGFRNGIDRVGYSSLHMPACDKSKQEGERQHEAADIESIMDNLLIASLFSLLLFKRVVRLEMTSLRLVSMVQGSLQPINLVLDSNWKEH